MYIIYDLHEKINDLHEKIEMCEFFYPPRPRVLYKIRKSQEFCLMDRVVDLC